MFELAYIGLGSNLDKPEAQIAKAIDSIKHLDDTQLISQSSLYLSEPMGDKNQQDYINAVVKLKTSLSPLELLDQLQKIENAQGRVRNSDRWSARTLDLDLLLYGNQKIESDRLTVPHYGMKLRNFVIIPLAEIEPQLYLPDGSKITSLMKNLGNQGIKKL